MEKDEETYKVIIPLMVGGKPVFLEPKDEEGSKFTFKCARARGDLGAAKKMGLRGIGIDVKVGKFYHGDREDGKEDIGGFPILDSDEAPTRDTHKSNPEKKMARPALVDDAIDKVKQRYLLAFRKAGEAMPLREARQIKSTIYFYWVARYWGPHRRAIWKKIGEVQGVPRQSNMADIASEMAGNDIYIPPEVGSKKNNNNGTPPKNMDPEPSSDIYKFFEEEKLFFPKELITNYFLSLKTKPFVLLTGISGTGKSKLAQLFADFMSEKEEASKTKSVKKFLIVKDFEEIDINELDDELRTELVNLRGQADIRYFPNSDDPKITIFRYIIDRWPEGEREGLVGQKGEPRIEWTSFPTKVKEGMDVYFYSSGNPLYKAKWVKSEIEMVEESKEVESEKQYCFVPVRPDWTDNIGLLGYYNPLKEEYEATPLLELLLRASKKENSEKPYFVILDEMNLAKVEHYFSDFLSCLESRRYEKTDSRIQQEPKQEPIILHNQEGDITINLDEKEEAVPSKLKIPLNVYFTGTVNIDETTYMFSPKVLDRANTIEFNIVNIDAAEKGEFKDDSSFVLKDGKPTLGETRLSSTDDYNRLDDGVKKSLKNIHSILEVENMHFGYRVFSEIGYYMKNAKELVVDGEEITNIALDLQILQKILPKFNGGKEIEEPLTELFKYFARISGAEEKNITDLERKFKFKIEQGRLNYVGVKGSPKEAKETEDAPPEDEDEEGTEEGYDSSKIVEDEKLQKTRYPRSAAKLFRMLKKLRAHGFVSFVE